MDHHKDYEEIKKEYQGTLSGYLVGCIASFFLTITSFYIVWTAALSRSSLISIVIGLAIVQSAVQLRYFLHLGKEKKPRWEAASFLFMLFCVLIIVLGSIWIMYDLNNRVMSGMEM